MDLLPKIGAALASAGLFLGSLFGFVPEPPADTFGASLPTATAVFETSLAAPISSSATSLTLAANAVRGGGSISGYACFTIDEGSSQAEFVCGTVSGTSVTGLTRGVSPMTGTTTVAALQFSHRRGASVKVTDFPVLQIIKAQNAGQDTFPAALIYDSGVGTSSASFPSVYNIPNRGYVDAIAFDAGAAIGASETAAGYVEIATGAEAAASTQSGSVGRLALPSSVATSTYNSATAANVVLVTDGTGKLDGNFIDGGDAYTFATTTRIGSFPAYNIGKNIQALTSTGTSTFSVPSGVSKLYVRLVAGGGNSGACNTTNSAAGGGGGGAGYSEEFVDVSATSTIQYYVGAATERTTFGTIGFEFLSATGGGSGSDEAAGGTGGTASGGDINIPGQPGISGYDSTTVNLALGQGGSSILGLGARARTGGSANGITGGLYGGGAAGAVCSNSSQTGAPGAQGAIYVAW